MNKKNNNVKNSKRAAIIAALILCILLVLHFFMPAEYSLAKNGQVEKDYEKLNKHIDALEGDKIDNAISKANFSVKIKEAGGKNQLDNSFVFKNSILVGDSLGEGIVDYRILDSSNVFAVRGKSLKTADDLFRKAVNFHPDNLFIEFGMNDIIAYRGKTKPFIKEYKSIIKDLKNKLPNTKIHVVSISTITKEAINNKPSMKNFRAYNMAMEKMCKDEKINFVDTTLLLDENSQYEFDGIHPKEPFYSNWVKLMCSVILEEQ